MLSTIEVKLQNQSWAITLPEFRLYQWSLFVFRFHFNDQPSYLNFDLVCLEKKGETKSKSFLFKF